MEREVDRSSASIHMLSTSDIERQAIERQSACIKMSDSSSMPKWRKNDRERKIDNVVENDAFEIDWKKSQEMNQIQNDRSAQLLSAENGRMISWMENLVSQRTYQQNFDETNQARMARNATEVRNVDTISKVDPNLSGKNLDYQMLRLSKLM